MNRPEHVSTETEPRTSRRVRRARAALGALVATLSIASQAVAGPDKNESLGCTGNQCVDSYEIRCSQASGLLCFTVEVDDIQNDYQTFFVSFVGTLPTSILGDAEIRTFGDGAQTSYCRIRPDKPGTMRALVSVTGSGLPPLNYNIRAQCYAGDVIDGLKLKKTTLTLKQDE
jgi:hypothetical protein